VVVVVVVVVVVALMLSRGRGPLLAGLVEQSLGLKFAMGKDDRNINHAGHGLVALGLGSQLLQSPEQER